MSSLFLIYKSGAGSGKTYTLTREYLKLALKSDYPHAYKYILAVTFTKKAAKEMKYRILDWLVEIAEAETPADNQKVKEILGTVKVSPEALQRRAELMHQHILHHYSDFSVQTIDSFVHRIIKSFSRDLKLSTDFEVEMDVEKVITEVVTDQLRDVGEDQELSDTLQNFLEFQLEEEKSTRLKTTLVEFFKSNSDEKANESLEKLTPKSFSDFKAVREQINKKVRTLKKSIKERQQALKDAANPLLDDITSYLKNWIKQESFEKFVDYGKTPINCLEKETVFTAKVSDGSAEQENITRAVLAELAVTLPLLDEYLVFSKLEKNCYLLALIQDYKKRFEDYKQENNTILISDFTQIIQDVIKDNPAPFIYERLGERYRYYLIDEFQDTSISQWQNFLPLITHTLAKGQMAMIVGDSKQAIYRWRNGDFRLFATLPEMTYKPGDFIMKEAEAQLTAAAKTEHLSSNYRSSKEVVEFNNDFFEGFEASLSDTGKAMYDGVKQNPVISKKDGYVEWQLFGEKKDDNELYLDRILEIIEEAQARDFNLGDIAILTRKNKKLAEIATFLNHKGVSTSSQEGLLLKNNLKVSTVMSLLQAVAFPQNDANNTQLFTLIEMARGQEPDLLKHSDYLENYSIGKRSHQRIRIWKYLKEMYGKANLENWKSASAYDALLGIISYLRLDEQPDDYLETLLDFSFHAARRGQNSVKEFLDYWQENDRLSLSTAEDKYSVKLMTVHKSKGLEFPVVIYAEPFSQGMPRQIWYDLEGLESPLEYTIHSDGGFFTKKNKNHQALSEKFSLIKSDAEHETSEKFLDGLNILYVALTRASQNLFVLGLNAKDPLLKESVIEVFKNVFGHDIKAEVYSSGYLTTKRAEGEEPVEEMEVIPGSLKTYDWKKRLAFRFSNKPLSEEEGTLSERQVGITIHRVLAEISLETNWSEKLVELKEHLLDEELFNGLTSLTNSSEWKQWFSEPVKIFNEKHLVDSEGNEYIPDRVMEFTDEVVVVDYKTGAANEKHADQVTNYVSLLSELFDKPVSGRLVYLREGEIVGV